MHSYQYQLTCANYFSPTATFSARFKRPLSTQPSPQGPEMSYAKYVTSQATSGSSQKFEKLRLRGRMASLSSSNLIGRHALFLFQNLCTIYALLLFHKSKPKMKLPASFLGLSCDGKASRTISQELSK